MMPLPAQEAIIDKIKQLCLQFGWEFDDAVQFLNEYNAWQADYFKDMNTCQN